jgi:phage shock protein C
MTTTTQLTRSQQNRVIGGVAGGIADYLGLNANLIRLGFILLAFASGIGIILYLVLLFALPREGTEGEHEWQSWGENLKKARQNPTNHQLSAVFLVGLGIYFLLIQLGFVQGLLIPLLFIVLALLWLTRK